MRAASDIVRASYEPIASPERPEGGSARATAQGWMEHLWTSASGRLSVQVLQEFYVTVTRKLRPGLPAEEARADIRDLAAWRPLGIDEPMVEAAWRLEDRLGLSFWDSLIVAAAPAA